VAGERRLRILSRLAAGAAGEGETKRLCRVCAEVTAMSGAGIMLMSGEVPDGSVCTTDEVASVIEELQYSLGEGPCVDAYRHGRPVLEADLAHPGAPRWPAFAGPAVAAGARAVFGFPLLVGAVRLGALNLYCSQVGPLSDEQHADALVLAEVAAQAILVLQAGARPGKVAAELEAGADFHYVVHQAAGMVAAQLNVSVGVALVRLRAYAFGNDRRLAEVAEEVVARTLRFDPTSGGTDPGP
jgi:GAF domain-containing protein